MGDSVAIVLDFNSIEKPFRLRGRVHDLGGTSYWTIARLTLDEAELLHKYGVPWFEGEPDMPSMHKRLALMEASRNMEEAETRLAALKAKMTDAEMAEYDNLA
jgi:hypothetical protein